ncbi:MAG: sulfite transporter TauE/SafE [Hydrogenophilales bacterium 17-61-76]|nr:MAG: sulfite transporter TauE/SafE [Hydrogenophilales bacterium 17-61-76]
MDILAILAGMVTGMVLGLFGSGGSIIALPALLYLLDVAPKSAIAMSLGVVGVTATIAAIDHWRRGNVVIRVALVFSLFGMMGTFAGARLGLLTPVVIQLGLFAGVMYAAAVGVGGGFLIVPALVLLSGIPMKQAVGTSLAIVAAKSYAGFAGYMGGVPIDYALMGAFTAVTVVGSFIGTRLAGRVSQATLKKAFAWFLVVVATYIVLKSVVGEFV